MLQREKKMTTAIPKTQQNLSRPKKEDTRGHTVPEKAKKRNIHKGNQRQRDTGYNNSHEDTESSTRPQRKTNTYRGQNTTRPHEESKESATRTL